MLVLSHRPWKREWKNKYETVENEILINYAILLQGNLDLLLTWNHKSMPPKNKTESGK